MDFNAPEMRTRSKQMADDKINIRLDVIEGMGHTMPSSEQFSDSLTWVDALQRERIESAQEKAQRALEGYLNRLGPGLAEDPKARKILIQITIDAPWSKAAWDAARLLGVEE
jgi:poly(3-hydroxybutyrate) depolymerase